MTANPSLHSLTLKYLEQQKKRGVRRLALRAEVVQTPTKSVKRVTPKKTSTVRGKSPERAKEFEALRKRALACTRCDHLVSFRHQVVFGVGNMDAELMFVGEAPGADEDLKGEPFVGRAGQLLTKLIQTMGYEREDVYIGNILKCRPNVDTPSGNRKPTPEEMSTCIPYLKEQIRIIQPKVLVALGDTAVKGLAPGLKEGITKIRGQWMEFEQIPLMPTFHPAYLLRNQSLQLKRTWWEDMLAVLKQLKKPISEKQRNYFLSAAPVKG